MYLEGWTKEVFRAKCNPQFQSVHCIAHLNNDIREVLPYLNRALGGYTYIEEPRSVTFKLHGRLITVHAREIAINALEDEDEADKVLRWLQHQINEIWERRAESTPAYESQPRPQTLQLLRLLPRTNCGKCGQPTCTVFATLLAEGAKTPAGCPTLEDINKQKVGEYLSRFRFDV